MSSIYLHDFLVLNFCQNFFSKSSNLRNFKISVIKILIMIITVVAVNTIANIIFLKYTVHNLQLKRSTLTL